MKLKARLQSIVNMVDKCEVLSDVGTDHGYIPIYSVLNNICGKAVAADVRHGPLQKAMVNIMNYGLQDRIETKLGYGLEPLGINEIESVVVAGMGGVLIKEILEKDMSKAKAAGILILQPMSAPEALRTWLYEKGFEINDEALCKDEGRLYNIIKAKWTGKIRLVDEIDCFIGDKLIEKNDPLLSELTVRKIRHAKSVLTELNKLNCDCADKDSKAFEYYTKLRAKLLEVQAKLN